MLPSPEEITSESIYPLKSFHNDRCIEEHLFSIIYFACQSSYRWPADEIKVQLPGRAKILVTLTEKSIFAQRIYFSERSAANVMILKATHQISRKSRSFFFYTSPIGDSDNTKLEYEIRIEHTRDDGATWMVSHSRVMTHTPSKLEIRSEDLNDEQDWNDLIVQISFQKNQMDPILPSGLSTK